MIKKGDLFTKAEVRKTQDELAPVKYCSTDSSRLWLPRLTWASSSCSWCKQHNHVTIPDWILNCACVQSINTIYFLLQTWERNVMNLIYGLQVL